MYQGLPAPFEKPELATFGRFCQTPNRFVHPLQVSALLSATHHPLRWLGSTSVRGKLWPMASPCLVVTPFTYLLLSFLVIYSLFSHLLLSTPPLSCLSFPLALFFNFSSVCLSVPSFPSLLSYSSCLISSHQIQFHLIFR